MGTRDELVMVRWEDFEELKEAAFIKPHWDILVRSVFKAPGVAERLRGSCCEAEHGEGKEREQ